MGYHSRHAAKRRFSSDQAPRAIGPYCQAIAVDLLAPRGRRAHDSSARARSHSIPATGEMVGSGDVRLQGRARAAEPQGRCWVAGGARRSRRVGEDHDIYLADMQDFASVNEVYAPLFPEPATRARHGSGGLGLPRGAMVERSTPSRFSG